MDMRRAILKQVIEFDAQLWQKQHNQQSDELNRARKEDDKERAILDNAQKKFRADNVPEVNIDGILERCVTLAHEANVVGHRGERILLLAAKAYAALNAIKDGRDGDPVKATSEDVEAVRTMALDHRRDLTYGRPFGQAPAELQQHA
jgi:magnesium chelatase subunit I